MFYANWLLTIFGAAILIVSSMPNYFGSAGSSWVIRTMAVLILLVAWFGVDCKMCEAGRKKRKR